MKIVYSHLHQCKTCHGTGLITPPPGTRASYFPCERCMGKGTFDEDDIVHQVVDAILPHIMKGCQCSDSQRKKGVKSPDCSVHELNFHAMAQAAIQIASRFD
ncbi:MAG: hypothetical protein HQL73_06480 [Magnetococcales bacterium]|nr:hypothetical protein [Magnetococcales bacterium]